MTSVKVAPVVSVVLPVYNSARHLRAAIQSILDQTFFDFELILVCDPSTDGSQEIALSFADPRILRVVHSERHGLVSCLNEGILKASGEMIARMDADDISTPDRFQKQISFLRSRPEIDIVGSGVKIIDEFGEVLRTLCFPEDHEVICWSMFFMCPIVHPSVMIRRKIFYRFGGYSSEALYAEDFELWVRLLSGARFSNLPDTLLHLRKHDGNISSSMADRHTGFAVGFLHAHIEKMTGREIDTEVVLCLMSMGRMKTELARQASSLVSSLFQIASSRLEHTELYFVRRDAAMRVGVLGFRAMRVIDKFGCFSVAFGIYPLWLFSLLKRVMIRLSGYGCERLVG